MALPKFRKQGRDHLTALAIRMKTGNRKAATALFDELLPKAYGFFFARTGHRETAEDLSQELFLKLVEKIERYDETRGPFVAWFWQMARNLLVDHYRGKKEVVFSAFADEAVEAMATDALPDMDGRLRFEKMRSFLATLGPDDRALFELRFTLEMPYEEIAGLLQRSEGALRIAAMRLKTKIKRELKNP